MAFNELAFKKQQTIDFYVEESMYSFLPLFDLLSVGHDPKSTKLCPTTPSIPPTSINTNGVDVLWSNNILDILLQLANDVLFPKSNVQPQSIELFATFFDPFVLLSIEDFDVVDDNSCDQFIVDFDCILAIIVVSDHVVVVSNVTNSKFLSISFKVQLKSYLLEIYKEVDNVNKSGLHVIKHAKLWANNAFDDLDSFGLWYGKINC